jgi:hypothetical protein
MRGHRKLSQVNRLRRFLNVNSEAAGRRIAYMNQKNTAAFWNNFKHRLQSRIRIC